MTANQIRIQQLFERYSTKEATPDEIRELYQLAHDGKFDEQLKTLLIAQLESTDVEVNYNMEEWTAVFEKIKEDILVIEGVPVKRKQFGYAKIGIAAAVALIVFGVYFLNYNKQPVNPQVNVVAQDIAPGKVGATLTLASGKKIELSDASNGELAKEAGVIITKSADGQLVYEMKGKDADPNKINTLSTAKGETYQVRLPDGSIVYLNAASSLTYAASLIERGKRTVRLEGEGYFEISKDKKHPFVVKTGNQEVEVLGTHFNINNYDREIKTTLLEGSVKISTAGARTDARTLRPGQQSSIQPGSRTIDVKTIDTQSIIAWKEGYFYFSGDLSGILDQISRWYDVEVTYTKNAHAKIRIDGRVSRSMTLNKLLIYLQEAAGNVRFDLKIEGEERRIIVK